jgi:Sec-independent protein secretion pathway component TatC
LSDPTKRIFSLRAIALGLVGVVAINLLTPFNNYVVANTDLIGNHLPLGMLLVFVFVVTVACMSFSAELFEWLRTPMAKLPTQHLVVLTPLELYITYLKLAFLAALFLSAPWTLLQLWLFIAPGLYEQEKRWVIPFVFFGTIFFWSCLGRAGALFATILAFALAARSV